MTQPLRILLAKPTHDSHDRGVRYLATRFRDAGFEVIFTNFLLPGEVTRIAVQEDVQVIGVSTSSGGHMPVFSDLIADLRAQHLNDVLVIGGGVIPADDVVELTDMGVAAIFGPGDSAEAAIALVRDHFAGRPEVA